MQQLWCKGYETTQAPYGQWGAGNEVTAGVTKLLDLGRREIVKVLTRKTSPKSYGTNRLLPGMTRLQDEADRFDLVGLKH